MIVMNENSCMVSNDNNTDDPQKGHIINYKALETDVDEAIKKATPDLFKNKTQKKCKYIQKVAEDRLSKLEITITAITFIAAVAVSLFFPYLITKEGLIEFIVGVFILILAICLEYCYWKPKYEACRRIILDAEQKLSEGSEECKLQQEIDHITPNTQEKPISIEYIKAQLDLSRMKMAGFLGGMLVLVNSIFQTTEKELIYEKLIIVFILFVLLIYLINNYTKYSKKLNEK